MFVSSVILFVAILHIILQCQVTASRFWPKTRSVDLQSISIDPEANFETDELIRHLGYPAEKHVVTTKDGYILTIYRIPFGKTGANVRTCAAPMPPVLLQHGLMSSSDDWVINFENQSLGFMLADAGFDVWLGNFRGNKYGLEHTEPVPDRHNFFQFSWDEMAEYDLPAIVDYILSVTGYQDLQYVAHSMGTTAAFALLSTKLDYNTKIRHCHALAPIATLNYATSPIRYFAPIINEVTLVTKVLKIDRFLPSNSVTRLFAEGCDTPLEFLCEDIVFLIGGYDPEELNATRLPLYLAHNPAGTSTKTVIHYGQVIKARVFQHYDHGTIGNLEKYGQKTPPRYNVEKITANITLYWGNNDSLASPRDVSNLFHLLHTCNESVEIGGQSFSHFDFVWGVNDGTVLNNFIISKLERYSSIKSKTDKVSD